MSAAILTAASQACAPFAPMSHDPDTEYLPPSPSQPLPPGKQPTGPMPDQDQPPVGPHHLPDDPVAFPEQDARWRRTAQALGEAALDARIP